MSQKQAAKTTAIPVAQTQTEISTEQKHLNIRFPTREFNAIETVAKYHQISVNAAIRRAINLLTSIEPDLQTGSKLFLKDKNGKVQELILP